MTSAIDGYICTPGQVCGCRVGPTEIVRLRERARAVLGPRFDLMSFDDAAIRMGPAPLTVVGEVVERWTAARGRA